MIKANGNESEIKGYVPELIREFAHLYSHLLIECPEAVYAAVTAYADELETAVSERDTLYLELALYLTKKLKEKNNEKH